jgi:hypothetical protein
MRQASTDNGIAVEEEAMRGDGVITKARVFAESA